MYKKDVVRSSEKHTAVAGNAKKGPPTPKFICEAWMVMSAATDRLEADHSHLWNENLWRPDRAERSAGAPH